MRLFAVIIGVNEYQGGIPRLRYAANDARRVYRALSQTAPIDDLFLLVNETATRPRVVESLDRVARLAAEAATSAPVCVFVYFSGHACERFLLAHDTDREGPAGICAPDLNGFFAPLNKAGVRTYLIADACFQALDARGGPPGASAVAAAGAGVADPSVGAATMEGLSRDLITDIDPGTTVLCACSTGERAFEADDLDQSVFTYYLMKHLTDAESRTTLQGAFDGARADLSEVLARSGHGPTVPCYRPGDNPDAVLEFLAVPRRGPFHAPVNEDPRQYLPSPVPGYYQATTFHFVLKQRLTADRRLFVVSGEKLTGKSTTLSKVVAELEEEQAAWAREVVWINCHRDMTFRDVVPFLANRLLNDAGARRLYQMCNAVPPGGAAPADAVLDEVCEAIVGSEATLILDHAGRLKPAEDPDFREFLRKFHDKATGRVILVLDDHPPAEVTVLSPVIIRAEYKPEDAALFLSADTPPELRDIRVTPFRLRALDYLWRKSRDLFANCREQSFSEDEIIKGLYCSLPERCQRFLDQLAVYDIRRDEAVIDHCWGNGEYPPDRRPESVKALLETSLLVKDTRHNDYTIHHYIKRVVRGLGRASSNHHRHAADYYERRLKAHRFHFGDIRQAWYHRKQARDFSRMRQLLHDHWDDLLSGGHAGITRRVLDALLRQWSDLSVQDPELEFDFVIYRQDLAHRARDIEGLRLGDIRLEIIAGEEMGDEARRKLTAKAHLSYGETESLARNYPKAAWHFQTVYHLARAAQMPEAVDAAFRLAQVLHREARYTAACGWLARGEELLREQEHMPLEWQRRQRSKIDGRRAAICLDLERSGQAYWFAKSSLHDAGDRDSRGKAIAYVYLSEASLGLGRSNEALVFVDHACEILESRALAEQPWLTRAHRCRARALLGLNDAPGAMAEVSAGWRLLHAAASLDEWREVEFLETRARVHFESGEDAHALTDLNAAEPRADRLKHISELVRIRHLRGEILAKQDRLPEACDEFRKAALLASKYDLDVPAARALFEIAKLADRQRDLTQASWAAAKAASLKALHGEFTDVDWHAVEHWGEARGLLPERPEWMQRLDRHRQHLRLPYHWNGRLIADDSSVPVVTIDVSRRGVCCAAASDLVVGRAYHFELDVPLVGTVQLGRCVVLRTFYHNAPLPFGGSFRHGGAVRLLDRDLAEAQGAPPPWLFD